MMKKIGILFLIAVAFTPCMNAAVAEQKDAAFFARELKQIKRRLRAIAHGDTTTEKELSLIKVQLLNIKRAVRPMRVGRRRVRASRRSRQFRDLTPAEREQREKAREQLELMSAEDRQLLTDKVRARLATIDEITVSLFGSTSDESGISGERDYDPYGEGKSPSEAEKVRLMMSPIGTRGRKKQEPEQTPEKRSSLLQTAKYATPVVAAGIIAAAVWKYFRKVTLTHGQWLMLVSRLKALRDSVCAGSLSDDAYIAQRTKLLRRVKKDQREAILKELESAK